MKMHCVEIEEDNFEYVHIVGVLTTYNTLCGFVDTLGEIRDVRKPPTCPSCIEVVEYCKSLHLRRRKI